MKYEIQILQYIVDNENMKITALVTYTPTPLGLRNNQE